MPKIVKIKYEYEGEMREQYTVVEEDTLSPWGKDVQLGLVGESRPRVDGAIRVTGSTRYTADVYLPGMHYAKLIRCPHPHAKVRAIHAEAALALPGVRALLTPRDFPADGPQPLVDEARYQGQEVAAIVAEDEELAADAARLVQVDYEVLPPVLTWEASLADGAPEVTPEGNLWRGEPMVNTDGDLEAGFAEADVVIQHTYTTPAQIHNALEPHGTVAHWENGGLTIYGSTQSVSGLRQGMAKAFGLSQDNVHVVGDYTGGGFGAKFGPHTHTYVAAQAARLIGRPVRLVLDRREEDLVTGNRSPSIQTYRIGAKRDGTLTAIDLTVHQIRGAGGGGGTVGGPAREMYRCPNVRTVEYGVYTHTGRSNSFRAPGYPEGAFGLESALDELANELDMDPVELRRRNFAEKRRDGKAYAQNSLLEAYDVGAKSFGWSGRGTPPDAAEVARRWAAGESVVLRGVGMAAGSWGSAGWPPAYAWVQLHADGTATVTSGTQDIGTGTKTALAMVAAEELGYPLENVRMRFGDTEMAPWGTGSGGSGTTSSMAPAIRAAAVDARGQLLDLAAGYFDVDASRLRIRNGVIHVLAGDEHDGAGNGGGDGTTQDGRPARRAMSVADVFGEIGPLNIVGKGGRAPTPEQYAAISVGVHFAEVAVDLQTGMVRVERVLAVHESGRVINPLTMTAQIEGGVLFGVGYALMEERRLDPVHGWSLNPNMESYKIATVKDVPRIETIVLNRPDDRLNNAAVKGIGEPPVIPPAPAIANAVYNATGLRLRELPLTPARVLAALAEAHGRSVGGPGAGDATHATGAEGGAAQ